MKFCERFLFIDGVDRTGKSTLKDNLVKTSNGKYFVSDRSPLSQIVYSRIYNRSINENFFFECMRTLNAFTPRTAYLGKCLTHIIYLYAPIEVLEERYKKTNEEDLDIKDYSKHLKVFNEVIQEAIKKYNITNILRFNSAVNEEQLVKNVIKELEQ